MILHIFYKQMKDEISFVFGLGYFLCLLWRLSLLGGETLAHVEVVWFDAAVYSRGFGFLLRLKAAPVLLPYHVVLLKEIEFLLEVIVFLDQELVHLHQFPIGFLLLFLSLRD